MPLVCRVPAEVFLWHEKSVRSYGAAPVVEADHIRPYCEGGRHELQNGILLRSDLRRLFDLGYVTIDPDERRVLVSTRIREEFENGRDYYRLNGALVATPRERISKISAIIPNRCSGNLAPPYHGFSEPPWPGRLSSRYFRSSMPKPRATFAFLMKRTLWCICPRTGVKSRA